MKLGFGLKKQELKMTTIALGMAERLLMVANGDWYGHHLKQDQYGQLFDDLVSYGLVDSWSDGTYRLSPAGVKAVNRLNRAVYNILKKI